MDEKHLKWDSELYDKSSDFQYELGIMAIDRLKPSRSDRILDIGCGNAQLTIELARRVPDGKVVGVEASPSQAAQGRKNIERSGQNNISIVHIDALDIKYKEEFEGVFSNSSIHWIRNLEKVYRKLCTALVPGGKLIAQTGQRSENLLFQTIYEMLQDPSYLEPLRNVQFPWRFCTNQENEKLLLDAGFSHARAEPLLFNKLFEDMNSLTNFIRAAALVPFLSTLPESIHERFVQDFMERYLTHTNNKLEVFLPRVIIHGEK